jgi:DNA-binding FrmR family transcriptional regulator
MASPARQKPPAATAPAAAAAAGTGGRTDLLHRLRRAEGQLRGIQRMVEEDQSCLAIAGQMVAVRKALDSAYVQMTVQFLAQGFAALPDSDGRAQALDGVLGDVRALLGTVR